eukprot:6180793-Pleurochrysis_carterae.AAC.6
MVQSRFKVEKFVSHVPGFEVYLVVSQQSSRRASICPRVLKFLAERYQGLFSLYIAFYLSDSLAIKAFVEFLSIQPTCAAFAIN